MLLRARSLLALVPVVLLAACGSDPSSSAPAPSQGGAGGASGRAGAGGGGTSAGSGASGAGGQAGKGSGGSSGSGSSGAAGSTANTCKVDTDCTAPVPVTMPAGCAEWTCEKGVCAARARDKDADTHRAAACKAVDGTPITTGDDCDDGDKETFPGAWDGPADGANPDRCDGRDQNCSNDPDDMKGADGKSCSCTPGDSVICADDGGGKAVTFPALDASGKPLGKCRLGKRTCGSDGKFAACVGTVPPDKLDICNGGVDDDCDGKADLADETTPPNLVTWSYDGDGDGYVSQTDASVKQQACDDARPTVCPTSVPSCDLSKWKLGSLPAKDCDDKNGDVNPAGVELCSDDLDNDCNGTINDDYASDAPLWYFDWDDDNYGDINTPPKRSCKEPATLPEGCTDLDKRIPPTYCADGIEGDPPTCPVPACKPAMWKRNIANTDCKDRPDQGAAGNLKGNKPSLVHPGAIDLCNGRDYNCDGSANTGCGCSPIGNEAPCGTEAGCNLATQYCVTGGTWDTSKCQAERARVDYCPDDDSDGYCDLTKCAPSLCPDAPPQDGHLYRERTKCLGFAIPDLGGSDCADDPKLEPLAKDINPGLGNEVCNGDGKDHDCNKKTNRPGDGDCECVIGGTVACRAPGHAYPVATPPDTFPYAPDPVLNGVCKWDHKTCINGAWTTCAGGIGANTDATSQIAELCNGDGLDHDCNGTPNTDTVNGGCKCQPQQTEDCGYLGPEQGICKRGKKTCKDGTFTDSQCTGAVYPAARDCASSVDADCDGLPDDTIDAVCACKIGTQNATCGTHPEDGVGACKAGIRDCVYDPTTKRTSWSACAGSVGPNPNAELCGPAAADLGCDGKRGNGLGCFKTVYVLWDDTQVSSVGPTSFLLSNSPTEAYYGGPKAGRFTINAYAKQPVGDKWVRALRCAFPQAPKWKHSMPLFNCVNAGLNWIYEGIDAYFVTEVPNQPTLWNPVMFWKTQPTTFAYIPFNSVVGHPYNGNRNLFELGKVAPGGWPQAATAISTTTYFAPGSLDQ